MKAINELKKQYTVVNAIDHLGRIIVVIKNKKNEYSVRVLGRNGKTVWITPQWYSRRRSADAAIKLLYDFQ